MSNLKFTREQVGYILAFFASNDILLVNKEDIGRVELGECVTDTGWIIDSLMMEDNPDVVYPRGK